jgi:hypothetical protein
MAGKITVNDSLFINEQSAAQTDVAGQGQIWVKDTTPNELWFTDDAGTDVKLGSGGHTYTDRDASDWDFELGDFTTDAAWHDLDLSSIVPAGAVLVHMHVVVNDETPGNGIQFRKNGNTGGTCVAFARVQAANVNNQEDMMVACDSNRVIEYAAHNTTFTNIVIAVKGWWI